MGTFNFSNLHIDDKQILECILDTMMDGVMVLDKGSRILAFNHAAERITGYKEGEVVGELCSALDSGTCTYQSTKGSRQCCNLFTIGKIVNKKCYIQNKKGEIVHLLKNAIVLRDKEGEVFGAVETMTDITSLFLKEKELEKIKEDIDGGYGLMGLVGRSSPMQKIFDLVVNVAESEAPVIILGESGTGKELVANAIHNMSKRKGKPFIKVNCAALNESLLESELFGHRKGAFTGAIQNRPGRFEAAHGGSLFLDEVESMPMSMQVKLLRVLQEKEVVRVGDNTSITVDVRIITATNKDLFKLVQSEGFREDLYYRVNVFPINLPPLRERMEDLPLLLNHILKKISLINPKNASKLSPAAFNALKAFHWPGNVRELINVLEYAVIICQSETIEINHLPDYINKCSDKPVAKRSGHQNEKERLLKALKRHNYSRTMTAKYLGISRVALWKKMKKYALLS